MKPMTFVAKKINKTIVALIAIASILIVGPLTLTMGNLTTAESTTDITLIKGQDTQTCPDASATITQNHADLSFSLYPSERAIPQPATYYTDLLRLKNQGTQTHNLTMTIDNIAGASNLGSLTIFLFDKQTDNPLNHNPIGQLSLNSDSEGKILNTEPFILNPAATYYFEVVGYADADAPIDSVVQFTLVLECIE